jgi:hypothetical protein
VKNIYKKKISPKTDRSHNSINGHDGEAYAKSKIIMALGAEVNSSSREMDNDKIDFHLNFQHPWQTEQVILHLQAKSGSEYGREINNERFQLKKKVIEQNRKIAKGVFIIWVNRVTNHVYWAFIHAKSNNETTEYKKHHQVTPAARYDFIRCFEQQNANHYNFKGGKGIVIRELKKTFAENRDFAKSKYKLLKRSTVVNPALGNISFTRLGWRHISRKDRKKEFKLTSFNITPYLMPILKTLPSEISLLNCKYDKNEINTTRTSEYILKYDKVILSLNDSSGPKKKSITVIIRLIENIIYPNNWTENAHLSQLLKRSIKVSSFYYK